MKILIIDDSPDSRALLASMLKGAGYGDVLTSESYESGRQVLEYCEESGECIDLIIMDISMPGINGIEATRLIKANAALRYIPIIIVTAMEDEKCLEDAFSAGANDYIGKPVNKVELRARVRAALKLGDEMEKRRARERELEKLTRELQEISHHDGLTGVPNRRWLDSTLEQEFKRALRDHQPLSLLISDIDFFKRYNDSRGHLEGDNCLKKVAKCINRSIRRPGDFMARYGGEEFMVVLANTELEGARSVADLIRYNLRNEALPHPDSDVSEYVTVSTGVAMATPDKNMKLTDLIAAADKALYQAKENGRNRTEAVTL